VDAFTAFAIDQNIVWLDIAMDDPVIMGTRYRRRYAVC
jgi:hypothetical protein